MLQQQEWANLQLHADVYLRTVEMAAGLAIQQIQPFIAQQWQLVQLLESELTQSPNLIQYGGGAVYGDGSVYGQVLTNSYAWQLDPAIKQVGYLIDQVINPEVVFDASNSYFNPSTSIISFSQNPFTLLTPIPVYDGSGNIIDRQVLLWARDVDTDAQQPWLRYGSIIRVPGQSSDDYVTILNAAWAMFVRGPCLHSLSQGLMASAGLRATVGNETIEVIQTDADGLCIVTDQNVYRFAATATPLVTVGEMVNPDQPLTDTIQIIECGTGRTPDLTDVPGLACGPGLISGVMDLVVFVNANQTWTYTGSDARFQLYGNPTDIENFWASVHARGLAAGKTLAQWLGLPGPTIPVNPLSFVIDNFIGNNLIIITVKPQDFLNYITGFLNQIPLLMPAGTLLYFSFQLEATGEQYPISGTTSTPVLAPGLVTSVDTRINGTNFYDGTPLILAY